VRALKVIVGLGNPGKEYATSRHNVGFMVLDVLAGVGTWTAARIKRQVEFTEGQIEGARTLLLKPLTFMNRNGPAIRDYLSLLPLGSLIRNLAREPRGSSSPIPEKVDRPTLRDLLLVVHDDLDLPMGALRFRGRGSAGGHRGVESLASALGTTEFGRLKVGIGRREERDAAEYVLEPLRGEPRRELEETARSAAQAASCWVRDGLDACANRINRRERRNSPEEPGTQAPSIEVD
jgi:PTH1 family peptidyl-tRNA hydrolase